MDDRYELTGSDLHGGDISEAKLAENLARVERIGSKIGDPAIAASVEAHVKPFVLPRHEA